MKKVNGIREFVMSDSVTKYDLLPVGAWIVHTEFGAGKIEKVEETRSNFGTARFSYIIRGKDGNTYSIPIGDTKRLSLLGSK